MEAIDGSRYSKEASLGNAHGGKDKYLLKVIKLPVTWDRTLKIAMSKYHAEETK